MFCPNCGSALGEDDLLCPNCGSRIVPDPQETAPEADAQEVPEALTEEAVEAEEAAMDETAEPEQAEETAEAEKAEDAEEEIIETDMDADAIVAEFLSEAAAAAEKTEEPEPAPIVKPKKSHKKLWAILIPVLVVVLLAAAAGGVYLMAKNNYEQATACVEAKQYEQAIELFEKFSFYADSEEQVAELNRLQKAYDDASALADSHDYVSAIAVLSQLGDYRDSMLLVETALPYARAGYLMDSAANADTAAYNQHPDFQDGIAAPEDLTIALYEGAAQIYLALGDHADSAELASQCYCRIAFVYMEQGLFEEALGCLDSLNETDAETVMTEYMTYCADTDALTSLENAVRVRSSLEEALAEQLKQAEEAKQAEKAEETTEETEEATEETEETPEDVQEEDRITYRDLVDAELELLAPFTDDLLYYDAQLKDLMALYREGLETEASALNEAGDIADLSIWYEGSAMRALAVETLIESYDFLSDNLQLQASFNGKSALYDAYSTLEKTLNIQLTEEKAHHTDEDGDFFTFENTTGLTVTLTVYNEFFDEEGGTVLYHETEAITIGAGETVDIPFMMPAEDEEWSLHTITWTYEATQNL